MPTSGRNRSRAASRVCRLQMTVIPSCLLMRSSASITTRALRGSSEAIGSSARMSSGSCIRARAMATRCCWPPESVSARCRRPAAHVEPVERRTARWHGPRSRKCLNSDRQRDALCRCRPDQHVGQHVEPVDQVELLEDHGAAGAPGAQRLAASAVTSTAVEAGCCLRSGRRSRLIRRSSVDLPAPERPMTPTMLPGFDRQADVVYGGLVSKAAHHSVKNQHAALLHLMREMLTAQCKSSVTPPFCMSKAGGLCGHIGDCASRLRHMLVARACKPRAMIRFEGTACA